MPLSFRDHFSSSSGAYAQFRPRYPKRLFEWLASESPARDCVWDCATGTGQAAIDLAGYFAIVAASDASAAQLASAAPHPRVAYFRCTAEASALASGVADAVVAAQAVHWFDMPAFFREAGRVAKRGGLVAVWTYGNLRMPAEVESLFVPFYEDVVGPYWPPERAIIDRGYTDVPMPFAPVVSPELTIEAPMTLAALAGYISTWSATARYREARGHDPVPELMERIAAVWGDPVSAKPGVWPMSVRAGRV
ncbi:MAG: methyltransferase domain-containing protein [Acidobacteriota bacterium]|nr:methyltransferase domain-containing protein [Acidobacteriota bacterium]